MQQYIVIIADTLIIEFADGNAQGKKVRITLTSTEIFFSGSCSILSK